MIFTLVSRNLRRMGLILLVALPAILLFEVALVHIAASFEATQFAGGAGLEGLVGGLPGWAKDLFNSLIDDFSTEALVALGFQHPVTMTLSITLTVLLAVVPAADRETGLLDLILSAPVPRGVYLTSCVICFSIVAAALPAAILAGGAVGLATAEVPGEASITPHIKTALSMSALLMAIGGTALWLCIGARRKGQALGRVACLLLPLWAVDFMAYLWDGLDVVRWISPFAYVEAIPGPMSSSRIEYGGFVLLGVFVVTTTFAFRRFARHDL